MADKADSKDEEEQMAACGACGSLLPMDSKSCPDCGVSFSGLNTDPMGECTACGAMNLLSSKQCWRCNIMFIGLDDVDGDGAVDLVAEDTSFSEEKKAAAELSEQIARDEAEEAEAEAEAQEAAETEAEEDENIKEESESTEEEIEKTSKNLEDNLEDDETSEESELVPGEENSEEIEEEVDEEDGVDLEEAISDSEEDGDVDEETDDEVIKTEESEETENFFSRLKKQMFPEKDHFPTELQMNLSSKKWIDIGFPILMVIFGIILIGTTVNQFVGVPIDMDGDPNTPAESRSVLILQHFNLLGDEKSDTSIDTGMNFHFNTFIFLISLIITIVSVCGYVLAKGWRKEIIEIKKSESGNDKESQAESDVGDEEEDSEEDTDKESVDDSDNESDEDLEDEEDEEDEIDVGSRVGVSIEHEDGEVEEFYGEIIEFDDDNDEVVVKDEETGEEVIVPQDSLFLD